MSDIKSLMETASGSSSDKFIGLLFFGVIGYIYSYFNYYHVYIDETWRLVAIISILIYVIGSWLLSYKSNT